MPHFTGDELTRWSEGEWVHGMPAKVDGVSTDTRSILPGSLFLALKGPNFDGHEFVKDAFNNGAAAAVVQEGRLESAGEGDPVLVVRDTMAALQRIASGYRRAVGVEIVGVTGSAGKSTVKEMAACILSATVPTARTAGNWNNEIGVPLSLLSMEREAKLAVLEIGTNHPGELAPLCRLIEARWGIVTNVGPVHLEFFGTTDAVASEKSALLRSLPREGAAVLLKDEEHFSELRAACPCRVVTVSMYEDADYTCLDPGSGGKGVRLRERESGDEFGFELNVPGRHNVVNAMFAIAVGRGHGIAWDRIRGGLADCRSLPMRWGREEIKGITVINDAYNANPMSMRAAIETFRGLRGARGKWLAIGGMLELGKATEEEHRTLGEWIGSRDWAGVIVVGALGSLVADGAARAGLDPARIFKCADNREAARVLAERMNKGDFLLLKGSRLFRMEEIRNEYVLLSV